jgi:DNA-binding transcriptional regulator YhcF (GntR family)
MQYNFSPTVRPALERARHAAHELGHDFVGPMHIVLGLLADGQIQSILARVWTTPGAVRNALLATMAPAPPAQARAGELPYTSRAKKSLEQAMRQARARRATEVTVRDLLHGVMRADPTVAQVLEGLGVTLASIYATERAPGKPPQATSPEASASPETVWFLQLDADDAAPMYEQIVRKVEEAVATGALLDGERLPTVRQLAEELAIAPGTVARAYADLESRGVVETDGARGTRVARRMRAGVDADVRSAALEEKLRPIVVGAYHLGAGAGEVMEALKRAMKGVY